jgi:hypothetical protein
MANCLGLGPLSAEAPSEWPIMVKKILLGLMFISVAAFLGHCFGKLVTANPVIQVYLSVAAVGIFAAAWYWGKNSPQPVYFYFKCPLCREWTDMRGCRSIPNIDGSVCETCSEHL